MSASFRTRTRRATKSSSTHRRRSQTGLGDQARDATVAHRHDNLRAVIEAVVECDEPDVVVEAHRLVEHVAAQQKAVVAARIAVNPDFVSHAGLGVDEEEQLSRGNMGGDGCGDG